MPLFEGGILGELKRRKQQRETDTVKDSFLAKLAEAGADEITLKTLSTIKADSPKDLFATIKSVQDIVSNTDVGVERKIKEKAREAEVTTLASESAKLDPAIVKGKLDVRAQEKQQDLGFQAQEAFIDIQKNILKEGTELDATEKQKLVFAEQGLKTVKQAQSLLNDQNFIGAVFQQAGGSIGKLSTAGNTQLRNYNTAIGSSIFSFVFANSGAQVSDKERKAFEDIYGLQVGDTIENGKFKAGLLADFFKTAKDVIDPNKVAGLSVAELNGKLNEIQGQLKKLGKGDSQAARTIIQGIKERALGGGETEAQETNKGKLSSGIQYEIL